MDRMQEIGAKMNGVLKKILGRDSFPLYAISLGATLLLMLLYITQPGILRFLDYKLYDYQLRHHHAARTTGIPVIVDIDEKSLAVFGQWPWPRYRLAMLLEKMRAAEVLAVGLDIVLAEPDRTSPALLKLQLKKDFDQDIDFTGLPRQLEDHDILLADTLRGKPYVLSYYFSFTHDVDDHQVQGGGCLIHPAQVAVLAEPGAQTPEQALLNAYGTVCPLPALAEAASGTGFFNATPDQDGIVRRVALLTSFQGKIYPSLALATLMQAAGDQNILLKLNAQGVESLRWGGSSIPLDRSGQVLVHYRGGPNVFPYISAVDILEDRVDPVALKGKIAFIGTSAAGLKDLRATPFGPLFPGVEAHATIVDNLLAQDFISVPDWAPALELGATLLAGLSILLLVLRATSLWLIITPLCLALGMWGCSTALMSQLRLYVSLLYPCISLAANFALLTLVKFWREEKQKKFIQGAFAHYLAPTVIKQIMESPETLTLQGQEKDVSIMFTDVRNFTSMSERLTPTQVTDLLHDYLTPMTRVIIENTGTLDKFIGDAIMAFWNAPLDVPEHQRKAVAAALQMFEHLKTLNVGFQDKYGLTLRIGVGLHCGKVHVGNMGSVDLFDYTLIGDNVNLASRIENLTKFYGQQLLISDDMAAACGNVYAYVEMDCVRVKGKNDSLTLYTAMSHAEAQQRAEEISRHNEALALYKAMRFAEAERLFNELKLTTGNETLYGMYAERCQSLTLRPPAEDWDGVYTHTEK